MKQLTRKSNASALEERAQDLFSFEDFAGEGAGGPGVAPIVGINFSHGLGDFA